MFLESAKQRVNIKKFMVAYLALLLVFSAWMLGKPIFVAKGLLIALIYGLVDAGWTYLRSKEWVWPLSSWISALIVGLLAWPGLPWAFVVILPALAAASKQLLRFGKARHIFNPAAFALGVSQFLAPAIAWWGMSWGNIPLAVVSLIGCFILWRQSRWHEFVAFSVSYLFFTILLLMASGIMDPGQWANMAWARTFNGPTVFFSTVMLIEPITSQFPSGNQRVAYGALVGFFSVMALFLLGKWPHMDIDPLVWGLLLGNLISSLIFLPYAKSK